ncbi:RNA polymerase sigma factor [Paractinoplanes rishiriensis]|uniref:RNA polymerase sigma factor n=1 Tax=Paractinoplanes rishiriensis TaxID=1050105 RepID=A0A919KAR2_9ACTN|nr:sigma factor-like helix-turn-helix DNA-binding protein [Actinoplanes rishiriensis]GIE99806.1 RNA polymerase sigma factor [Actinoplanes rishiriensis]
MSDNMPVELAEFFRNEYLPLVAFAQRIGLNLAEAEDAVQEAFGDLTIAWHDVKKPAAWMRLVVRRKAGRTFRSRWRFQALDGFEFCGLATASEPDEPGRVLHLLRRLSYRQMVVLAWSVDGYSPAEIAEIEGMTGTDVRKTLRQARARLARFVEEN